MRKTSGEILGLRTNHYYVTCKTVEEYIKVLNELKKTKAISMDDFHPIKCRDGILVVSNERVPAFRGLAYKEWRKLTNMIYTGRR